MKRPKKMLWLSSMLFIAIASSCCYGQAQQQNHKNDVTQNTTSNDTLQTIKLDKVKVTWLCDNAEEKRMPISLFKDTPDSIISKLHLQDGLPASVSTFLVQTEGINILFDTGNGIADSQLLSNLSKTGLTVDDIRYIYLTHLHGDHIGGMLANGQPVFTNAEVYVSKTEYDAWINTPSNKNIQQKQVMEVYNDRLHLFTPGDTLPGHITSIDATGHTPGHTAYQKGKLLIIGDLIHGAALQIPYPEICASFDMDKTKAIQARKALLKLAKENHLVVAGMHLPAPGFKTNFNDLK